MSVVSRSRRHMTSLTGQRACVGIMACELDMSSSRTGPKPAWTTLPPCSTLKPARSGFRKVSSSTESDSCPIPGLAEGVLEMRVKEGSKIRNLLGFAMSRMQGGVQCSGRQEIKQVLFTGSGRAITKTITCAEIMKRQIRGLHQVSKLQYRTVREQWEGRDSIATSRMNSVTSRMTIHRMLPAIYILLSKDPLDPNEPGYQPPGELDPNEPGYQPPGELDPNEPGYQPPGKLDLNQPGYKRPVEVDRNESVCQPPGDLNQNWLGYQPPVRLHTAPKNRKSDKQLHSPLDHLSMLGYHPPAEPFILSHRSQPAEVLPSHSSGSQSESELLPSHSSGRQSESELLPSHSSGSQSETEHWPSGSRLSGMDCSKLNSSETHPLLHPYRAGEELCLRQRERIAHREGERIALRQGSRKRRTDPRSISSQPQTKAARFDEGNA